MKTKTLAFGCREQFLDEKHTEAYIWYGEGVSQLKIGLCAKNSRRAIGFAGRQAREVQVF
jgi:hypothetical protein